IETYGDARAAGVAFISRLYGTASQQPSCGPVGTSSPPLLRFRVRQRENRIRQPSPEALVVAEVLEEVRVIGEEVDDHPLERAVVLDSGVLAIGVGHGVPVLLIRRDTLGQL